MFGIGRLTWAVWKLVARIGGLMAELENLNESVVKLTASVDAAVAKLGQPAPPAGVDPAAVQAAADAVNAQSARLDAAVGGGA